MAITKTKLKVVPDEVTAITTDGTSTIYYGTNKGNVYSYSVAGTTTTLLMRLKGAIKSMVLYSSTLYIGLSGGEFCSLTTS